MRLTSADVDRYGPLGGCRPPCADAITVVAGPNESGKTLYLEALLQLLEPDVADQMEPGPRVETEPTGRVVVEDGTDHHALGNGTTLSDVSRIEPAHLSTLFVVRDSDLDLPDGATYYRSLVEHLGDIHTTEIEAIREGLVDEGLLTPVDLNLRDREHDTKTVRRRAESLADDVDATLETAAETGIDELARTRLTVQQELRTVERRLDAQRTARELAAIDDAADHLERYRSAAAALESARVDRETLNRLRELDRDLAHNGDRLDEIDTTLETTREELDRARDALGEARQRRAERVQRRADVDRVEQALEAYRDRHGGATAASVDSKLAQRRTATVAGLVGAGLAGAASAFANSLPAAGVAVGLVVIALAAGWSHRRLTARAGVADALERDLVQRARDAGFDVEGPDAVPVVVREYRDELDGLESRIHELETQVEGTADRVAELEASHRELGAERQRIRDELTTSLEGAGVDSIDAYESRVERLDYQRRRHGQAKTVLCRELLDPDPADPDERIAVWESALDDRRAAVDAGIVDTDQDESDVHADQDESDIDTTQDQTHVDADQYDEATLARLEDQRAELESRLEAIDADLESFRATLDEFERRANELSVPPVVESTPTLEARTIAGLRGLAAELRSVADRIDENADVSRNAIGVLDSIAADEQRKVATLFDPTGPASETLAQLTDGRYTAVEYDHDARSLAVHRADGRTLAPAQLSQGTRDQLYFAARLSLARQLLGGNAGFLLLDDPFLAADHDRLRNGFETLSELADNGWQILYCTAKREVHETMADEFGCPVYELEAFER